MIVMKFGGTSVEDAEAIRRVIEIVRREAHRQPLIVVSACAGTTNELVTIAHTVRDGDQRKALSLASNLRDRHRQIAAELLQDGECERILSSIEEKFQELKNYVRGIALIGELTDRSLDTFMSFGECLSSLIVQSALASRNIISALVDAREVMITDRSYTCAQPEIEKIGSAVSSKFLPLLQANEVVVTQGFIGSTEDGTTTTIGRGGSDLSASIFGAALHAEEIQIWTDVDGMMTADPRVVSESLLIGRMSFDEASELAYFGAKVLHPKTILPAIEKAIPVRVLNSRRPESSGTLIVHSLGPDDKRSDGNVIKSIACKRGITVINVGSSRMLMAHGFLAKLFSIFAEHQKSVDVVATSEVSVSLTVDNENGMDAIIHELEQIGEIKIRRKKAIVCVVGEGMRHTPGIAARIFGALAREAVNIEMVSEGASEINLTLVVDESDVSASVRVLHKEFFG